MRNFVTTIFLLMGIQLFAQSYITVKTPKGQSIEAITGIQELSSSEIQSLNEKYKTCFSQATYLGSSTTSYNCHAYAWHITEGGDRCWINQTKNDGSANVALYWTNDAYTSTTESSAEKIFYYDGDHSAVKSSTVSGMYESKWGSGPLMRHAPGYGPYPNMSNRNYYNGTPVIPSVEEGLLSCSNGSGPISVNQTASYWAPKTWPSNYTYKLRVENAKEDDVIGTKAIVSDVSMTGAIITFTAIGLYEIYFEIYNTDGYKVASYWFEPVVE